MTARSRSVVGVSGATSSRLSRACAAAMRAPAPPANEDDRVWRRLESLERGGSSREGRTRRDGLVGISNVTPPLHGEPASRDTTAVRDRGVAADDVCGHEIVDTGGVFDENLPVVRQVPGKFYLFVHEHLPAGAVDIE